MEMKNNITRRQGMVTDLLNLIDAMNSLRNQIATVLNIAPTSVHLGISKDGLSFDLTVNLTVKDDPRRLAQLLEIVGVDGLVFRDIQNRPALGHAPRRIMARVLAPEQALAAAA